MPPRTSWDATALLNPQGLQADAKQHSLSPSQLAPNGVKPETSNQVNLQFQFSNATDTSSGYSQPSSSSAALESTNPTSIPTHNGMGSMIERINNVQDRSFVPGAKRRRIEEESGNQKGQNGFHGSSSAILSDYVNEKKREVQSMPAASQSQPTLDLTGGIWLSFLLSIRHS